MTLSEEMVSFLRYRDWKLFLFLFAKNDKNFPLHDLQHEVENDYSEKLYEIM